MKHMVFALVALMAATSAQAETQRRVAQQGVWSFSEVRDLSVTYGSRRIEAGKGCAVTTGTSSGSLRLVFLPGNEVLTEVQASVWSFARRTGEMRILWEGETKANTTYGDAEYAGTMIRHVGNRTVARIIAAAIKSEDSGVAQVFDRRDRRIAQFSMKGLPAMLKRAITCSNGL